GFEKVEEALDAVEAVSALDDGALLLARQLTVRHVRGNPRRARELQQVPLRPLVLRLGERLDGAARQAQLRVGDDEVEVEADGVAEPLAGRASAERVVEAEQARLR